MAVKIQLRRGTAAQWTSANPILASGEPAVETDTGKRKMGDGVTAWGDLPYELSRSIADDLYPDKNTVNATLSTLTPDNGGIILGGHDRIMRAPLAMTRVGMGSQGSVCVSWDDGYSSWMQIAEMAAERNQRHTFFFQSVSTVIPGRLTPNDVREIQAMGHEIATHGHVHINYETSTSAQRVADIDTSIAFLEDIIGEPITTFAYPFGARSADSDRELYGRLDRVAGVSQLAGALIGLPWTYAYDRRRDFVTGRLSINDAPLWNSRLLSEIARLRTAPHILTWFSHDPGAVGSMTWPQVEAALDAIQESGAAAVTYRDAFPSQSSLVDPSFESGSLDPWSQIGVSAPSAAAIVTDTPATGIVGSKSAHITNLGVTTYISQMVPVLPNVKYTLSGRVRSNDTVGGAGGVGATLRMAQFSAEGSLVAANYSSAITTPGWSRAEVTATTLATTRYMRVDCCILTNQIEAWFDHLHFAEDPLVSLG
jgi:peptidoglycan/xylan/chitin deacetylase (PgdA/CDA1 family)